MFLAIDIGNTNTKLGLFDLQNGRALETWRVSTTIDHMPDEWQALLSSLFAASERRLTAVTAVAIASVVPIATGRLGEALRERLAIEPVVLTSEADLGIAVRTASPAETGVDRVLNGLAAFRRFNGPVIVVDCGTATKIDAVSGEGEFLGGAIAPGVRPMLEALTARAARLYAVELTPPPAAIGRSTVASVQSGVVLGYIAMCEGLIRRVSAEIGPSRVVVTGGAGRIVADHVAGVTDTIPTLTMEGIVEAYRKITGGA